MCHTQLSCIARERVSSDGQLIVFGGHGDSNVRVWDTKGKGKVECLQGHKNGVFGLSVSDNGRLFMSGGYDKTVRLWDAGELKELACFS